MGIASLFILIQSPNGLILCCLVAEKSWEKGGNLLGFSGIFGASFLFYNSSATKRMVGLWTLWVALAYPSFG
ncbi:hypothetical protein AAG906_010892 [Vitis piasezkii]